MKAPSNGSVCQANYAGSVKMIMPHRVLRIVDHSVDNTHNNVIILQAASFDTFWKI
jgi:hypothetical protein